MKHLNKSVLSLFTIVAAVTASLSIVSVAKAEEKSWPKAMVIATGHEGGAWYAVGVGLAEVLSKSLGITVTPSATQASGENINLLYTKEAQMGGLTADAAYDAFFGKGLYEKRGRQTYIRTLFKGMGAHIQFFTLRKSNIKSVSDIRGKRFISEFRASTIATNIINGVLEAYGITKNDFKPMVFSSYSESAAALKEGRADIAFVFGHPNRVLRELELTHPIRILSIDPDKMELISKKYIYMSAGTVPADTYKTHEEDVLTVVVMGGWYTHKDVPESLIYEVTKYIMDHPEKIASYHPDCKLLVLKRAFMGAVVPYHEGAVRYYKERGVWSPELEKRQKGLLDTINK